MVGVAVRALLWAVPVGIAFFGVALQSNMLVKVPGRWIAAAWIVTSVLAGIPDITGGSGEDGSEVCYDKQGAYSC
jgi:hypothetical protein